MFVLHIIGPEDPGRPGGIGFPLVQAPREDQRQGQNGGGADGFVAADDAVANDVLSPEEQPDHLRLTLEYLLRQDNISEEDRDFLSLFLRNPGDRERLVEARFGPEIARLFSRENDESEQIAQQRQILAILAMFAHINPGGIAGRVSGQSWHPSLEGQAQSIAGIAAQMASHNATIAAREGNLGPSEELRGLVIDMGNSVVAQVFDGSAEYEQHAGTVARVTRDRAAGVVRENQIRDLSTQLAFVDRTEDSDTHTALSGQLFNLRNLGTA